MKKDYAASMRTMEGNQAIVDAVKADVNGVGYVGVGYVKEASGQPRTDIHVLTIARDAKTPPVSPLNEALVLKGDYPIFRPIYQYLSHLPAKNSVLDQFLRFEGSEQGQKIIKEAGFYTLTDSDKKENAELLQKVQ